MHSPVCSTFHFRRSSFAPSPAPFERTKDQRYVCAKKLHDLKYINVNKSSRSHSSFLMRTWPFRRRPIHLRSSGAARISVQLHPFRIMQLNATSRRRHEPPLLCSTISRGRGRRKAIGGKAFPTRRPLLDFRDGCRRG